MKTYQSFANDLLRLLGNDNAVRLTVHGFMPLSVEDIGRSGEGKVLVAVEKCADLTAITMMAGRKFSQNLVFN